VLIVSVDPPRWGDQIFVLEREFPEKNLQGTVFVHRKGSTAQANAAEMKYLQERLVARADRVAIVVEWVESSPQILACRLAGGSAPVNGRSWAISSAAVPTKRSRSCSAFQRVPSRHS
jgi:hypothetical protein